MEAFANILIFHPAAIGDAMLATPVTKALKLNYPMAKITYWSHASLRQLIFGLCPSVDDFLDFSREASPWELRKTALAFRPDLFVDLSNSRKGQLITLFSKMRNVRYVKRPQDERPIMHAVENFLETVTPLCPELPGTWFPTIFPEALAHEIIPNLRKEAPDPSKPLLGIVPGVGSARGHRAWIYDGWLYLLRALKARGSHIITLIGGEDEVELCKRLAEETELEGLNLAGKLSLPETAAVLKSCEVVIAGDTGPAHIANAVGTPVIAMHGPTFSQRSGPYDSLSLVLDQSKACQCKELKSCRFTLPGTPGECMNRIMLPEILERLDRVLGILDENIG